MSEATDPSDNQSTPETPHDGRGSELGGAPGSANPSRKLIGAGRLIRQNERAIHKINGEERDVRVLCFYGGYAMVRRRRAAPYVAPTGELFWPNT